MSEIKYKEEFIKRYQKLTDFDKFKEKFKEINSKYLRRSIRINTLKIKPEILINRLQREFSISKIKWSDIAYFVEGSRRDLGNLVEHSLGYFYIQEAASLIPPLVLDPNPGELVLDMAASPGSKTTQMAAQMQNSGLIIANDAKYQRLQSLYSNLQRCGVNNTIITLNNFDRINNLKFDKILLDAPCSGTGAIRKSLGTLLMWNPNMI